MGMSAGSSRHIVEEAARWVARLQSSDASPQDHEEFARWMERDPENAAAYGEMSGLWKDLTGVTKEKLGRRPSRVAGGGIIGLALVLGLSTVLYQMGFLDRLRADEYTQVGEVRKLTLTDGSVVTLDTDSAVKIDYRADTRRIVLLRGRAFFDVEKDSSRPFIVHEGDVDARALGTHYEVDAKGSGGVAVEEGRVSVIRGGEEAVLGSGEMATFGSDGSIAVKAADVANMVSWRDGKLVFSGQRLSDVLALLGHYRRGAIVTFGNGTADIRVSGVFDVTSPESVLDALEATLPVTVTRLTDYMILVRSRQSPSNS